MSHFWCARAFLEVRNPLIPGLRHHLLVSIEWRRRQGIPENLVCLDGTPWFRVDNPRQTLFVMLKCPKEIRPGFVRTPNEMGCLSMSVRGTVQPARLALAELPERMTAAF